MTTNRTVAQKLGDFNEAFEAVRAALEVPGLRALGNLASTENVASIKFGLTAATEVMKNDRTAAIVAAMLTQSGVSRVSANVDAGTVGEEE